MTHQAIVWDRQSALDKIVGQASFLQSLRGCGDSLADGSLRLSLLAPKQVRFIPDSGRKRWVTFDLQEFSKLLSRPDQRAVEFRGNKLVEEFQAQFALGTKVEFRASLSTDTKALEDDWIALCRLGAAKCGLAHGFLHSSVELQFAREIRRSFLFVRTAGGRQAFEVRKHVWVPDDIAEVYWWTAFPQQLVETFGRERFRSAPAERIMELDDGSVLLRSCADPDIALAASGVDARARIRAHLCPNVDLVRERERLRKRCAFLVPFEANWTATTQRLLLTLFQRDWSGGREFKALRRLREFQPPRGTEQAHLSDLVASDCAPRPGIEYTGVQGTIERYHRLSDSFVRKFRKEYSQARTAQLPKLLEKRDPESLLYLDRNFWGYSYIKHQPELVEAWLPTAVGAYLGCLIETHLGGEWVPREKTLDSQIVAGGRVWYPFRRATQILNGPRGNVLRYSLFLYYTEVQEAAEVSATERV